MTPVSIWRAAQISSPNLESFPSQLSKFGYHQTPDRLLSDTWHTSDWLLADSQQTSDGLTLNPIAEICWRWHQVSIWRAVQISSPNLESFQNQLSNFGYHQTSDRLLTDCWHTPDWLPIDFRQTHSRNLFEMTSGLNLVTIRLPKLSLQTPNGLLTDTQQTPESNYDRQTSNPKTVSKKILDDDTRSQLGE